LNVEIIEERAERMYSAMILDGMRAGKLLSRRHWRTAYASLQGAIKVL
jgi:hypothetical protein